MLLLVAVLAVVSVAFLLFRFAKRHDSGPLAQIPISNEPPVNARPLFAPSADELRREAGQAAGESAKKCREKKKSDKCAIHRSLQCGSDQRLDGRTIWRGGCFDP